MSPQTLLSFLLFATLSALNGAAPQKQTFRVAMRDGVHLATDVYGAEPGVRKPVLLLRTPYDKNRSEGTALRQVAAGYVAVVQDARGAFASEGHYIHHNNDDQDGFDTLEWISQQPWSNGHAGMWGSSHPGAVQWLAAAERPYGLEVIAPTAASPSLYRTAYLGGALRLALIGGAGPLIDPATFRKADAGGFGFVVSAPAARRPRHDDRMANALASRPRQPSAPGWVLEPPACHTESGES